MNGSLEIYRALFLRYLATADYYCDCHKNHDQCETLISLKKSDERDELIMGDYPEVSEVLKMLIDRYSLASDCDIGEAITRVEADCHVADVFEDIEFEQLKNYIASLFKENEVPRGLRDLILFDVDSDLRRSFYKNMLQKEAAPSPMALEAAFIAAKTIMPYSIPSF